MKNFENNDPDLESDPVWKLLSSARRVEPGPFFSRNVVREVRALQDSGQDRGGILEAVRAFFSQPLLPVAAGAAAAVAILAVVFASTGPAPVPDVAEFSPNSVDEIPVAVFNPAEEIENIEYLGELMAVADPADLDDAALADLYLMASR